MKKEIDSSTKEGMNKKEKLTVKEVFELNEVWGYFFRKKDPSRPSNFNIKMMHGINKISIIVFLLGIIFLVIKNVFM